MLRQVFFSKEWLEAFLASFRNFLTLVFRNLALPKLLAFQLTRLEEPALKMRLKVSQAECTRLRCVIRLQLVASRWYDPCAYGLARAHTDCSMWKRAQGSKDWRTPGDSCTRSCGAWCSTVTLSTLRVAKPRSQGKAEAIAPRVLSGSLRSSCKSWASSSASVERTESTKTASTTTTSRRQSTVMDHLNHLEQLSVLTTKTSGSETIK